jgi:hypothetical protein
MFKAQHTRRLLICLLAVLPVATVGAGPRKLDLTKDERLSGKISLRGGLLPVHQVVRALGDAAGAFILVQGDLLLRSVQVQVDGKTCAQVMEKLAELFGGVWIRQSESLTGEDGYLLLTDEVTAGLVARHPQSLDTRREEEGLFRSLTRSQRELMMSPRCLLFTDLTREQQRLVKVIARNAFLMQPYFYPSSVLRGEGARLYVAPRHVKDAQGVYRPVPRSVPASKVPWPMAHLAMPMILDDGTIIDTDIADGQFAP